MVTVKWYIYNESKRQNREKIAEQTFEGLTDLAEALYLAAAIYEDEEVDPDGLFCYVTIEINRENW